MNTDQGKSQKQSTPEEAARAIRWGGVKVTSGTQTVLNQLKVLMQGLQGKTVTEGLRMPPQRKKFIVIAGIAVIGLIAWFSIFGEGGRNCIASAFDYQPTCSDDPQDEERTEFNRGGDGTCKKTVVNGRNIGKCLRVTSNNQCVPCE